jgi:signal transduction histidine kinase
VVDVAARIRRVVDGHLASGEPESRFVLDTDAALPEMWLDPDKIDQVLANLVENALRHGGGTVTIQLRRASVEDSNGDGVDDGCEVVIADEGDGIPDETRPRIFTKFWRGGNRRGGTGLGLYIVKGIVEAHGGSIVAERSASGGAQFRFTLPAGAPPFAV